MERSMIFWDPAKDSLFAVAKASVIAVYADRNKAALAAEDIGGHVAEIKNQDLPDFWFENSHLSLIR